MVSQRQSGSMRTRYPCSRRPDSAGVDDRAYVLAVQRAGEVAAHETVDDLNLAHVDRLQHVLEHDPLHDEVVQIPGEALLRGDLWDERRALVLLRIVRVQPVL